MRRELLTLGVVVLAGGALHSAPAAAQAVANTEELSVYGGWLLGQELTDQPVSATNPRIADHVTYGARYDHNFTNAWGLEAAVGQTETQAVHLPAEDTKLRLRTGDLDVIWNFNPEGPVVGYTLMGMGYGQARLAQPIAAVVNGEPATLSGRNTFTANIGIGARLYLARYLIVRIQVQDHYFNRLINTDARQLDTLEATFGVGFRF